MLIDDIIEEIDTLEIPLESIDAATNNTPGTWSGLTSAVMNILPMGMLMTDAENNIISVNTAFCAITGYQASDVLGKQPTLLRSDRHSDDFYKKITLSMQTTGTWAGDIWSKCKNGQVVLLHLTSKIIRDNHGEISNYVSTFEEVFGYQNEEEAPDFMIGHDALTRLPNRALLMDRLHQSIAHARRSQKKIAIAFVDLDGFKTIKNKYGYDMSDAILVEVARRIKKSVRASDTVARIGSRLFAVIMEKLHQDNDAYAVAQKIQSSLARPYRRSRKSIRINPYIGIGCMSGSKCSGDILLKKAYTALYKSDPEHGQFITVLGDD